MPGQAEVVEACEGNHLLPGDPGRPAVDPLVGEEKRIGEPGFLEAGEPRFERGKFRKRILGNGGRGSPFRHGLVARLVARFVVVFATVGRVKHPFGNAVDQVATGIDRGDPLRVKPHPIAAFDSGHGIPERGLVDPGGHETQPR